MKLVALAALVAVCGAAKLDRTYLPPSSAATAGGSSDSLQTPLSKSSTGQEEYSGELPTGSYTNNFQGVVVDAAEAGIRSSDGDQSGLGGSRDSYGSTNSKVGDAAFRGSLTGFRSTPTFGSGLNGQVTGINVEQNFGNFETKSERPQAFKDRNSNIISYANDVSSDNYSYGFESDNGIAIGENGVASNGIQAQGGYSYKGDDGQVYKVTYVADEGGYRPQGAHLPTPPPIPKEILESLEQNAKEEAAGVVDDGSYDAQKYNAEGDYTHHNGGNVQYNGAQLSQFAKRPESDATSSSTFINQNSQAFGKPEQLSNTPSTLANFNGQSNQFNGNKVESVVNDFAGSDKQSSQILSGHQQSSSGLHNFGHSGHSFGTQAQSQGSQFGIPHREQTSTTQAQTQISQFGSHAYPQGSTSQFAGQPSQVGSQINREEAASQFGAQPNKPLFGHGSNSAFNSQSDQVTQFGNQEPNLQGVSNLHTPTQNNYGPTQVSQTQFSTHQSNIPSLGSHNSNKPAVGQEQSHTGASNDNRFPSTTNKFGAEYLPPFKPNDRPSYNKPQINDFSSVQQLNKEGNSQDSVPLQGQIQPVLQSSSASSHASVGSAGFEPQPLNVFGSQFSRPNQSYNNYYQVPSQKEKESNAFSSTIPTTVPETELITPLEPNEKPAFSQGTQFNSQATTSFGNPNFQTTNNQVPGFQNTASVMPQSSDQAVLSSFTNVNVRPHTQFDTTPTQAVFSGTQGSSNIGKPQLTQNSFTQNQQSDYYSTQKPSFGQGPDDSYYYNQPSKPFGTPTARPDPSRFPSSPSYQSNGIASLQNNQFSNQQGSLLTPSSPTLAPTAPTSPSQYAQTVGIPSTNYYNGITQAAISPFPSASPTSSSHFGSTQKDQLVSKPSSVQPSTLPTQFNRPSVSQPSIPSFPTKPLTTFGQNPSTSFNQNQIQFGQSSSTSDNQSSTIQSFSSKPASTFGQTTSTNQIQSAHSSSDKNDQSSSTELSQEQQTTSSQQYQGTIYEYNKPPEVLPAPEQSDSASSQSSQTDTSLSPKDDKKPNQDSKPQFGTHQTQFGQTAFTTQTQQFSANQNFKPFGNSQPLASQFQQSTQRPQGNEQPVKPNETALLSTTQFGQNLQTGFGSGSQFGSQPGKPLITASRPQFDQISQQSHGGSHLPGFTSFQTQGAQSLKPIGSGKPTQSGQNTFTGLGTQTLQQNLQSQTDKPFGSAPQTNNEQPQGSQFSGFTSTHLNSQSSQVGAQPFKPFATFGSNQGSKPIKPLSNTDTAQDFQGYPSSKPPTSTQLTHTQFSQTSQQAFGATQFNSQPARNPLADSPTKPIANVPSNNVSPDSQKPQYGQNTQFSHGNNQPFGSSFGQQTFQGTQFASTTLKPQFGTITQFGQSQKNPTVQPLSSASSQAQFGFNSAQASSSAVTQQQPQSALGYKPFGAPSPQGSSFQNKPQFDQAPQSSGAIATQSQFGSQSFKPFSSSGPQNKPEDPQKKPFGSQQGSPCCQGSKDSAIVPLNVGKPSQAFAQTQSQFTGFQGAQGFHSQSVAGKGEEFGGARQPPSFDAQTGYHY